MPDEISLDAIQVSEEQDTFTLQMPLNHPITQQLKRILLCANALAKIDCIGYKRPSLFPHFGFKQLSPSRFLEKTFGYVEATLLTEVSSVMMLYDTPANGSAFIAMGIAKQTLTNYESMYLQSPH